MKQSFRKDERLKSDKVIEMLFSRGNTFLVHPFRVNWLTENKTGDIPAKVLIGVSRKNLRKAVQRNQMKRLCREAYRKNKHILYDHLEDRNLRCDFSIIFIGKERAEYSVIEQKIITILKRLISELEQHSNTNTSSS
ncbi:MAG: ribonuclease P protein component [Bacteroidota bacterium]